MNICIIGVGYVGLPLAAGFANVGNSVICLDMDQAKIENLKNNVMPIYEPGLEELVRRNQNNLHFTTDKQYAILNSDIIFICVGTPSCTDGTADLSYVLKVAEDIGTYMETFKIVVDKSTVPIGTADKVKQVIQDKLTERKIHCKFQVASNPEFMREGCAVDDVLKPDRIVIGTNHDKTAQTMKKLYEPFVLNGNPIVLTDIRSAEMIKYASNCFLATKISFMNEMANICEAVGADVTEVRRGMASDRRIGDKFLYSGIGFGGSCLVAGTRLLTENGQINIESLKEGMQVYDDEGLTEIIKLNTRTVRETIRIKSSSFSLRGSTDHIHFIVKNEKLEEVLLKDIKLGDYVYVTGFSNESSKLQPFLNGWKVKVTSVELLEGDTVYSIETASHKYIANNMLTHNCFPKDLRALNIISKDVNESSLLLQSVIDANEARPQRFVRELLSYMLPNKVSIWGTAFKPETDDIRESSAIKIIQLLLDKKIHVSVYDPMAMDNTKNIFGDSIKYCANQYETLVDSDCILLCTEWSQFRVLNWELMRKLMKQHYIFDGRNQFEPKTVNENNFNYISIGRKAYLID